MNIAIPAASRPRQTRAAPRFSLTERPALLGGLLERRTELADEIRRTQAALRKMHEALRSLDHLILLEDPSAELPQIAAAQLPDRPKMLSTLARGDVSQLSLETVRKAGGAVLTSREVTAQVVRLRQLTFPTRREESDFASSVTMALTRHARRGLIEKVAAGQHREGHWRALPEGVLPSPGPEGSGQAA